MRKLILSIMALLLLFSVFAAREEFRILKFWSESEEYLPFEPIIIHAFVLTSEGAAAKPMSGLDIHVLLEGKNYSRSIPARFDEGKNHYIIHAGVVPPGRYSATLLVRKEMFYADDRIEFEVQEGSAIPRIAEGEPFTLGKGGEAALGYDLLIMLKNADMENATLSFTDANATVFSGTVSEGSTVSIAGFETELLAIFDGGVKLRVSKAKLPADRAPGDSQEEVLVLGQSGGLEKRVDKVCDGCLADDGVCRLVGNHFVKGLDAVYCAQDRTAVPLKTYKMACAEDYECYDYNCNDGLCQDVVEKSAWQAFLDWINSWFI